MFPKYYTNTQRDSNKNIFSYFIHHVNFILPPFISFNICMGQLRMCIRITYGGLPWWRSG